MKIPLNFSRYLITFATFLIWAVTAPPTSASSSGQIHSLEKKVDEQAFIITKPSIKLLPQNQTINFGPLLWHEEFKGAQVHSLDQTYWTANIGSYSSFLPTINSPSNVLVNGNSDGILQILTSKIFKPSYYTGLCAGKPCQFQSGEISTRGKLSFKYGYLEVRFQTPSGEGNWPAIWMCPLGNFGESGKLTPGEIDLMEWYGNTPSKIWSTLHYPSGLNGRNVNDEKRTSSYSTPGTFASKFHKIAIYWIPNQITFLADDQVFSTFRASDITDWPFNEFFYLIINGNVGPQPNSDLGGVWHSNKPSVYKIDWVRFWSVNGQGKLISH